MADQRSINLLVDVAPVSEFERQIVKGVNQFCIERSNYRIRTATTETSLLEDADVIDGVIAMVRTRDPRPPAMRFGKPVVNVSTRWENLPFPTIAQDNLAAGKMAAEHLLQQGYRSFAYHMESQIFFSQQRFRGFAEALDAAGHSCATFDTDNKTSEPISPYRSTIEWLRKLPKPLGLFTHNDLRAMALLDVCHDAGLNVPDEVGVIGCDNDILIAELATPNLSSVDCGVILIGYLAAQTLARMLDGQSVPKTPIYLPPKEVVVRQSTNTKLLLDDRLQAALAYIRKSAPSVVSMEGVLDVVPASRRSLERLFRTHLGRSPAEEIRRVRINHAKWLLVESDRPLGQIAEKCGYSTFHNFATAFRREVGLSASAYRKQFRNK